MLQAVYACINRSRRRALDGVRLIHDELLHFDEILTAGKSLAEALREHAAEVSTPNARYVLVQQAELLCENSAGQLGLQIADVLAGFTRAPRA